MPSERPSVPQVFDASPRPHAPAPRPRLYIRARMRDALQALLREASEAKRSADFWRAAASILSDWAGGARLSIRYRGMNESVSELETAIEFATRLAVMVGRRAALERERRLGSFVVELARWLLAAPETHLVLRYALQSLMELVDAQGAFVALKLPDGENLRVSPALGDAARAEGLVLG